jgi:hypothetical protein
MTDLPFLVQKFLNDNEVDLSAIDNLNGVIPGREVISYRVHSTKNSYILKNCRQKREFDVYTKHSTFFKENNINIPEIFFSCKEDGEYWIVIEDVPNSLPKSRWKADSEQITLLYHLHSKSWDRTIHLEDPFISPWNEESMEEAQKLLPMELKTNLNNIRTKANELFIPLCCISGDPNPTNWGVRDNGDIVLFDFERIGYGNPAIDLAITMPGLGTQDGSLENEIAVKYVTLWQKNDLNFPFSVEELIKQIHIAKLWSALDFLANNFNSMSQHNLKIFVKKLTEKMNMSY